MSLQLSFSGEAGFGEVGSWYGASSVTSIGDLLCEKLLDFGPTIQEVDLTIHYPIRPNALQKIGWGASPPEPAKAVRRLHRKRARLEIRWVSTRRTSKNAFSFITESRDPDVFHKDFADVADALTYGTGTLNASDAFDRAAFLDFVHRQRIMDRGTPLDIQRALERATKIVHDRLDSRDPWDKLDIDWDDMHPDARTILDDPQDWSNAYDFAPHGNDTGADIFACWSDYKTLTARQAATEVGWDPEFDLSNDLCWKDWVEINLALAFGHIKKTGTCPLHIAQQTQDVLRAELQKLGAVGDWEHKDSYTAALTRYCAKIDQVV